MYEVLYGSYNRINEKDRSRPYLVLVITQILKVIKFRLNMHKILIERMN